MDYRYRNLQTHPGHVTLGSTRDTNYQHVTLLADTSHKYFNHILGLQMGDRGGIRFNPVAVSR